MPEAWLKDVSKTLRAHAQRIFPERQIHHHSDGQVRYLTFSSRMQMICASVAAVAFAWFVFASATTILNAGALANFAAEKSAIKARYEGWLTEARENETVALALLENRTGEFHNTAQAFQRRHEILKLLVERVAGDGLGIEPPSPIMADGRVMMAPTARDPLPRQSRYASAPTPSTPFETANLDSLRTEQTRLLAILDKSAHTRAAHLKDAFQITGLDLEDVSAQGVRGEGGPFIRLTSTGAFETMLGDDDAFSRHVARVAGRLAQVEQLNSVVTQTPLAPPVDDEFWLSSNFGARLDPITRRLAFHPGVDIGAYHLAPIVASAPGKVTFSGWKTGYGRMVEIDHGYGFKTRYGHLAKTLTEKGDVVTIGQKVGTMGASGRVTGTHLHYELWYKGKPQDPNNFLKADAYFQ